MWRSYYNTKTTEWKQTWLAIFSITSAFFNFSMARQELKMTSPFRILHSSINDFHLLLWFSLFYASIAWNSKTPVFQRLLRISMDRFIRLVCWQAHRLCDCYVFLRASQFDRIQRVSIFHESFAHYAENSMLFPREKRRRSGEAAKRARRAERSERYRSTFHNTPR